MDFVSQLKDRGAIETVLVEDKLKELIRSEKRLTVYHGIDPTSKHLHLGHMMSLRVLRRFQTEGHNVIFLIGDYTARIGDPTDKLNTRKKLSESQVKNNFSTYTDQTRNMFRSVTNPISIRYNSSWYSTMGFDQVLELASNVTVQQIFKREMFQRRVAEDKPIFLQEFLYPLIQGYDSVMLNADVEIGGRDQLFNMLVGRDFVKKYQNRDKHLVTVPLLLGLDSRKMGKTEGNTIDISARPDVIFLKITQIRDTLLPLYFNVLTDVEESYIKSVEAKLKSGENMINERKELAVAIVRQLRGETEAQSAKVAFEQQIEMGLPANDLKIIDVSCSSIQTILDLVYGSGFTTSKNDARRIIKEGGIRLDGEKVTDAEVNLTTLPLKDGSILKIGKRGSIKIQLNST